VGKDIAVDVKLESMVKGTKHEMQAPAHICRAVTGKGRGADSILVGPLEKKSSKTSGGMMKP
jgi:hypothetical protein